MTNHEQHHPTCDSAVSNALTVLAVGGAVVVGGLMLAPHILPSLGIGSVGIAERSAFMLHDSVGIAGDINTKILAHVPFIGSTLAEGGFFNAIASGLIGFGGLMLGEALTNEDNAEMTQRLGALIKWGALATSALIALPTVLTAIGSGLIFLSHLSGNPDVVSNTIGWVNDSIGTIGEVGHSMLGFSGLTAVMPHLATCGVAMLPAAVGFKQWRDDQKIQCAPAQTHAQKVLSERNTDIDTGYVALDTKGKPLPEHDDNHKLTPAEIELTQRYEQASPAQRIILKKHIEQMGYTPEYHDDATKPTVHLYQHGKAPAAACCAR